MKNRMAEHFPEPQNAEQDFLAQAITFLQTGDTMAATMAVNEALKLIYERLGMREAFDGESWREAE